MIRLAVLILALASICYAQEGRKVLRNAPPVYPMLAKRMNLSGAVKIKAVVAADGTVRQVEVIGGNPLFAQAAVDAVTEWRYESGKTETPVELEFKFHP